jgi:beta-glucosidase
VLRVRFRLGEFDPFESGPYSKISPDVVDSAKHHAVALKAAEKSIVLLQNRDRLLPLDKAKLKKIAVIGPLADRVVRNNYNGRHDNLVSALEGIRKSVGPEVQVLHEPGSGVREAHGVPGTKVDLEGGFSAEASVKFEATAVGDFIEFAFELPQEGTYQMQLRYKSFPARGTFQASLNGKEIGRPVDMYAPGQSYSGEAHFEELKLTAGKQLVRFTAVGKNDKSGGFGGHFDLLKLTGAKQTEFEMENQPFTTGSKDAGDEAIEKAVRVASGADAAVVIVGTDETIEQEGLDRTSLGLPAAQERLIQQVLAANPRTIVIEMSAGPLTAPWLKSRAPAILQAWWPGAEGGSAIANVLFGDVNPAGRLPHTVYASEEQVPPVDEYDISKGFTYMYLKGEPLFAFGHGLSYTTFGYSDLQAPADAISAEGVIPLRVTVKNTGDRAGDEVVQLYLRAKGSAETAPPMQLRGFERITLLPQEQRAIAFDIPAAKLAIYDESKQAFVVNPGEYEVMVGSSSSDIRAKATIRVGH